MSDTDPRPRPPEKPLPGDCCDGGCDNCVLVAYTEALEAYGKELAAWRERHPDAPTQTGPGPGVGTSSNRCTPE